MDRQFDDQTTSKVKESTEGRPESKGHMNKKRRIEQEVLKTLRYFDKDISLEDTPGFFVGVQNKIRSSKSVQKPSAWAVFQKKVLVPAVLFIMIVLNIVTAIDLFRITRSASLSRQKGIAALAEYYAMRRGGYASYLK